MACTVPTPIPVLSFKKLNESVSDSMDIQVLSFNKLNESASNSIAIPVLSSNKSNDNAPDSMAIQMPTYDQVYENLGKRNKQYFIDILSAFPNFLNTTYTEKYFNTTIGTIRNLLLLPNNLYIMEELFEKKILTDINIPNIVIFSIALHKETLDFLIKVIPTERWEHSRLSTKVITNPISILELIILSNTLLKKELFKYFSYFYNAGVKIENIRPSTEVYVDPVYHAISKSNLELLNFCVPICGNTLANRLNQVDTLNNTSLFYLVNDILMNHTVALPIMKICVENGYDMTIENKKGRNIYYYIIKHNLEKYFESVVTVPEEEYVKYKNRNNKVGDNPISSVAQTFSLLNNEIFDVRAFKRSSKNTLNINNEPPYAPSFRKLPDDLALVNNHALSSLNISDSNRLARTNYIDKTKAKSNFHKEALGSTIPYKKVNLNNQPFIRQNITSDTPAPWAASSNFINNPPQNTFTMEQKRGVVQNTMVASKSSTPKTHNEWLNENGFGSRYCSWN
jgi:hypothetical protein